MDLIGSPLQNGMAKCSADTPCLQTRIGTASEKEKVFVTIARQIIINKSECD
jgi:hypothetical protein